MRTVFSVLPLLVFLVSAAQVTPPCLKAVRSQDAPYMPTGPQSIAKADFNADGHIDFALVKSNSPEINILLGDGSGIYNAGTAYTQPYVMGQVITADFNADGKADLATANTGGDSLSVYLGNGNGTFAQPLNLPTLHAPTSLCALDFNGDGKMDIACANSSTNVISLFANTGGGSFNGVSPISVTSTNCAIQALYLISDDFNADGLADIAMFSGGFSGYCNELYVLLGNGAGVFTKSSTLGTGGGIAGLISGDYNQDGIKDIVFTSGFFMNPNNMYYLSVCFGDGSGGFPTGSFTQCTDDPSSLQNGDFDGDGTPDIAMTNYGKNLITLYLNSGTGAFPNNIMYAVGSMPLKIEFTDVNHDNKKDIIVVNHYSSTLNTLLGSGNGWYAAPRRYSPGVPYGEALLADLNNDGKKDVVFPASTPNISSVGVMWGTGTGSLLSSTQTFSIMGMPSAVTVADFDNNGSQDIAVADGFNNIMQLLIAGAPGNFTLKSQTYPLFSGTTFMDNGDFNGDGLSDIVAAAKGSSLISVLHNTGNANFSTVYTYTLPGQPYGIAVGDFNGDGLKDIAASIFNPGLLCVLKSLGSGNFAVSTHNYFPTTICGSEGIVTGNFNGDNRSDIALVSYNCGVHVYTCSATGVPSVVATYSTGSGAYDIATSDFNGDGNTDLVVADYVYGQMTVHSGHGDGTFEEGIMYETGNYVDGVLAGDLSADNKADILLNSAGFLLVLNAGVPSITVAASANNICEGTPVTLTASGALSYNWSSGATGSVAVVSPTITTVYSVLYFNSSGCGYAGPSLTVNVLSFTPAVLSGLKNPVCYDDTVLILAGSPPGGSFSGPNIVGNTFVADLTGTSSASYSYTDSNHCTHVDLHVITVDTCLGVEEVKGEGFSLYPNPATSSVNFFTNGPGVVYIYSNSGTLVLKSELKEGQNTVDCGQLQDGLYIVNVVCGSGTINTKLIKH